jgi:hypothetical protein
MRRSVAALALGLLVRGSAWAGEPDAAAVVRRAETIRTPRGVYAARIELVTRSTEPGAAERRATFSMAANGATRAILLRHTPKVLQGGGYLITGDDHWALAPFGDDTPRRQELGDVLLGEIAGPAALRLDLAHAYAARVLGRERVADDPCLKLELTRTRPGGMFTRLLYWVTVEGHRPRRLEGYGGEPERLLRMIRYDAYARGQLGLRPARLVVEGGQAWEPIVQVGISEYRRLRPGALAWSLDGLVALRNMARPRVRAAEAPDFVLEELVARLR